MSEKKYTFSELVSAYNKNVNIMKLLREGDKNSPLAIQMSYDLQTGSYVKAMSDPAHRKMREENTRKMAEYIKPYLDKNSNVLEAGIGEGTTLACLLKHLPGDAGYRIQGFDISWSRLHYAGMYLKNGGFPGVDLFMATLTAIPLPDSSVDVVFTSHAIEPNHGNEEVILQELYRVAGKALIMFEPGYELAHEKARARMEEMGYCRGLPGIIGKNGWTLKKHELMASNDDNPTAAIVVEKNTGKGAEKGFACPLCGGKLLAYEGNLFCGNDGVVFPMIRGIPSLLPESAIIASKYTDEGY